MIRTRRYQQSFLTKPRRCLEVRGSDKAAACLRVVCDPIDGTDRYPCSLLGLINALPCRFGWPRLAADVITDSREEARGARYITGWRIVGHA